MSTTAASLLFLTIALSAAVQLFTDPRINKRFIQKSLVALLVYFVHAAIGGSVLYVLIPLGPKAALGVTLAFVGWIGLGVLGLIRFSPRLKTPPKMLLQVGAADAVFLLLIVFGLISALG